MSRVFLARETRLGRRVVVKLLRPELAAGVSADRFEQEIQVAAQLQDPRIVPVLSAGDAGGVPFYTMPFVDGESLRSRMARPVPVTDAVAILRDIALALEYAHARRVVHRDIKPENVLLSQHTAVITDFGIAKAIAAASETGPHDNLTQAGTVLGTPAYMAPEQVAGGLVDHRADLYAWGVVAYELLAGAHPFADKTTPQAVMGAHITEAPTSLAIRRPGLPPVLVALVGRALAKDPALRPSAAGEIVRQLDGMDVAGDEITLSLSPPKRLDSRLVAALLAAVLVGAVVAFELVGRPSKVERSPGAAGTPRSLAVMPFANVGGDTADGYFAEGMADELTTALAQVPGLRVAARSSAFRFQGRAVEAREVGRVLQVHAVLEGTVRRAGERLRVTAQLTNSADGLVLWADRYDRGSRDVFEVQDEITQAIVGALRGTLGGESPAPAGAPRGTRDLEAYDLYLKGRYFFAKRGEQGLQSAIDYFRRAVARDPDFARGHAGLAMAYVVLPVFSNAIPVDSALEQAQRSASLALAIDSTLSDAHLALANSLKMRWRWAESERHFREALGLAPTDATTHHWYGVYLFALGRVDESVAELGRAAELDPFGSTIATDHAIALYSSRRFAEALAELERSRALDTDKSDTQLILGMVQLARARPDSALLALRAARRLGTGLDERGYLVAAYRALGRQREADAAYAELRQAYRNGRALAYDLAVGAVAAGDRAAALDAVERTIRQRHMFVTEFSLPCDPLFDPLKSEPRFGQLLREAGMRMCPAAVSR
jgi:TolB-like protein/Tfp pilus assembly protein PilF